MNWRNWLFALVLLLGFSSPPQTTNAQQTPVDVLQARLIEMADKLATDLAAACQPACKATEIEPIAQLRLNGYPPLVGVRITPEQCHTFTAAAALMNGTFPPGARLVGYNTFLACTGERTFYVDDVEKPLPATSFVRNDQLPYWESMARFEENIPPIGDQIHVGMITTDPSRHVIAKSPWSVYHLAGSMHVDFRPPEGMWVVYAGWSTNGHDSGGYRIIYSDVVATQSAGDLAVNGVLSVVPERYVEQELCYIFREARKYHRINGIQNFHGPLPDCLITTD